MGIIQRQSIKNTLVSFFGVLIGGISVLFIYPLDDEIYGLAQFLYSTAFFLVPFGTFGVLSLVLRFYPQFKDEKSRDHGFLSLMNVGLGLALILFFVLYYFFSEPFYSLLASLGLNRVLIEENQVYILTMMVLVSFTILYQYHAQNFQRIVVPQIINGLAYKFALPALVLLYHFDWISRDEFCWTVVGFFGLIMLAMVAYSGVLKQLKFSWDKAFLDRKRMLNMGEYSFFGALNLLGSVLAFRIDSIMIATMLSLASNGVYNKVLFIAAIIDIPTRAIIQIAAPIISEHCEKGNLKALKELYQKSSLNLFVVGLWIFLLIWFTIDDIFGISINPESFAHGKEVFLFLALGKLFDMLMSVNSQILVYSRLFRYNILFVLLLGALNVVFNYWLIGEFEIVGAAMSTCISLLLFNLVKFIFIYVKMGIQPLSFPIIKVLLIGAGVFGLLWMLPDSGSHWMNLVYKSALVVVLYGLLILKLKVSPEFNELYQNQVHRRLFGNKD